VTARACLYLLRGGLLVLWRWWSWGVAVSGVRSGGPRQNPSRFVGPPSLRPLILSGPSPSSSAATSSSASSPLPPRSVPTHPSPPSLGVDLLSEHQPLQQPRSLLVVVQQSSTTAAWGAAARPRRRKSTMVSGCNPCRNPPKNVRTPHHHPTRRRASRPPTPLPDSSTARVEGVRHPC